MNYVGSRWRQWALYWGYLKSPSACLGNICPWKLWHFWPFFSSSGATNAYASESNSVLYVNVWSICLDINLSCSEFIFNFNVLSVACFKPCDTLVHQMVTLLSKNTSLKVLDLSCTCGHSIYHVSSVGLSNFFNDVETSTLEEIDLSKAFTSEFVSNLSSCWHPIKQSKFWSWNLHF